MRADPDQALYAALMEALGYASNRKPFRELSERVPMASLATLVREPGKTRLLAIKAMLLGAAGLLSHASPPEEARELQAMVNHLDAGRSMPAGQWKLFR